ncbi:hypothetical protein B0H19DRAFT_1245875 [Mycena capillaripes]|nr:hypothetical protein B0H19DRAFT_1245875 [Mycena capillaripes]
MVFVKMVPFAALHRPRRRVSIANIVSVPLVALDPCILDIYQKDMDDILATAAPGMRGVAILIAPTSRNPDAKKEGTLLFVLPVGEELFALAMQPTLGLKLQSHSFGTTSKISCDLDALYWAIEDELNMDDGNYYGMQVQLSGNLLVSVTAAASTVCASCKMLPFLNISENDA